MPNREGLVSYYPVCPLSTGCTSSQRPPGTHVVEQLGFLVVAAKELPTIGVLRASQEVGIKEDLEWQLG